MGKSTRKHRHFDGIEFLIFLMYQLVYSVCLELESSDSTPRGSIDTLEKADEGALKARRSQGSVLTS